MRIGKNFEIDFFELLIICGCIVTCMGLIFGGK